MKEGIDMSNEELYTLIREYLLGDDSSFNKFYDDTKKKVFANIYSYVKNDEEIRDRGQRIPVSVLFGISYMFTRICINL